MSVDGLSEIRSQHDLRIPTCGDTVAANRYTPEDVAGPLPALLMYTPYHKDDFITYGGYDPLIRYLAGSGYEVIVADMVGTGASSGEIWEMFPQREASECVDIIEWVADQAWSDGRVGMFGKSYGGITSLYAAAEDPEPLKAIVPIHTPYTGYRNGYFSGGVFEYYGIGLNWLTLMQGLDVKPPNRRDGAGRWAEIWKSRLDTVREREPWLFQFMDHEAKDDYWQDKDIQIDRILTPTFAVGGWRDGYAFETMDYFEAIDGPKRLLMGPWRHVMPHRGRESAVDFRPQAVEWFDHFLKGDDTGALDRPEITYWTERSGGGKIDEGLWRGRSRWPTAVDDEDRVSFAIDSDGLTLAQAPDSGGEWEHPYDHSIGAHSYDNAAPVPGDTNADDGRSLTFQTEPLESAVEYTGTGLARLRIGASTDDPIVVARVMDVAPDGAARHVSHGQVRLRYRDGPEKPREVEPQQEYELGIPLKPKSHVFESGHRVRLGISAAWFPRILSTRGQGRLTLKSAPSEASRLVLPGQRLGSDRVGDRVAMSSPDLTIPAASTAASGPDSTYEISRERRSGVAAVKTSNEQTIDTPFATVHTERDIEAKAAPDDPLSQTARSRFEIRMDYDTETVRVLATNHVSRDATQLNTLVTIDGEEIFHEHWSR